MPRMADPTPERTLSLNETKAQRARAASVRALRTK